MATKRASTTKKTAAKPKASAAKKKSSTVVDDDALLSADEQDDEDEGSGGGGGGRNLVIVESPAKAKTITKILGKGFQVKASVGHIRDLPKKKLGVDVDDNFMPVYEVMGEKMDVAQDLQKAASKAKVVYLAADPDREGEAIAWHVQQLLSNYAKEIKRVEFHEITKQGVRDAMEHPREINYHKVDAQQARRVLDRLVGYKLSPLLWKKVNKGLSAGRVQSVAVRIICEREAEIEAFVPVEYWTIHTELTPPSVKDGFIKADVSRVDGQKPEIGDEATATKIVNTIKKADLVIEKVSERTSRRNPQAPFITSSLQREASNKFGYAVKRTMQLAQQLYEGIELGGGQIEGLITYMRTDSTRISQEAIDEVRGFIESRYGKDYLPEAVRTYESRKKNIQDAHEAIRPTSVERTPESIQHLLQPEQFKVYKLIWDRFVACQMESAQVKTKSMEIAADNVTLRASHSEIVFPGYMALYRSEEDDDTEQGGKLPDLKAKDPMKLKTIEPKQHFTEPPPRYSEATLVKAMEELGIGRPSTYAPTITTVVDRGYIIKPEKALIPTELGKAVNKLLIEHFPNVVDVHFTADLETQLDTIEESGAAWQKVVGDFFFPFRDELEKAEKNMEKVAIIIEGQECPTCGKPMQLKTSRWGSQFLGCTGYPECKSTKPLDKDQKAVPDDRESTEPCEKCNKLMMIKYGRFGEYLACPDPDCKTTKKLVIKTGVTCPQCKTQELVQRKSRYGKIFYGCPGYPECVFALWAKPSGRTCPECNSLTVEKDLKKGPVEQCSSKECKWSQPREKLSDDTESQAAAES